jgi:hypothetical protein
MVVQSDHMAMANDVDTEVQRVKENRLCPIHDVGLVGKIDVLIDRFRAPTVGPTAFAVQAALIEVLGQGQLGGLPNLVRGSTVAPHAEHCPVSGSHRRGRGASHRRRIPIRRTTCVDVASSPSEALNERACDLVDSTRQGVDLKYVTGPRGIFGATPLNVRPRRFTDMDEPAFSAHEPPLMLPHVGNHKVYEMQMSTGPRGPVHATCSGTIDAICSPAWSSARSSS